MGGINFVMVLLTYPSCAPAAHLDVAKFLKKLVLYAQNGSDMENLGASKFIQGDTPEYLLLP